MNEECIFCKIGKGDIPSKTVYEDDDFRAILDIAPAAKGHVIILPKNHSDDMFALSDIEASKVYLIARRLGKALKDTLQCDGINILQNNGSAAGQTVFHFHMHVIPRYDKDNVSIGWSAGQYEEGEMEKLLLAIQQAL